MFLSCAVRRRFALVAAAICWISSGAVRAAENGVKHRGAPVEDNVDFKLRFNLPLLNHEWINGTDYYPAFYGVGRSGFLFGVDLYHLWRAEAGWNLVGVGANGYGYEFFLRGGVMACVYSTRDSVGARRDIHAGGYLGYELFKGEFEEERTEWADSHNITISGSIEETRWWRAHFGTNIRLLISAVVPFSQELHDPQSEDRGQKVRWRLLLAIQMGFAF